MLSGGVDSQSIFFSLLSQGIPFETITFYATKYNNHDLAIVNIICNRFGVKNTQIQIPSDDEIIKMDIRHIKTITVNNKKTVIECVRPFIYVCDYLDKLKPEKPIILTGLGADDLYCSQKKLQILLSRKGEKALLPFRKCYTDDPAFSNYNIIKYCESRQYKLVDMYNDKKIETDFLRFNLRTINRPVKIYTRRSYPEIQEWHKASFQIESGISRSMKNVLGNHNNYDSL